MQDFDGRKISQASQAELRKRAVHQVQSGKSPKEVAQAYGFHRSWIYRALTAFVIDQETGLDVHKAPGRLPILDD